MKFTHICKKTQMELKAHLTKFLKSKYNNVVKMDGFIYAEGTFPVLLVSHMDTVHKETVKQIVFEEGGNKISSPQGIGGDDRCGIYMISKIIEEYKCSVLFTEDEEIGCVGAEKYIKALADNKLRAPNVNYIIELDRKGSKDAVFYNCDNQDFEDFILKDKEWKLDYGSYTDIVEIAPILGVAAVNFSCGYYNAHQKTEYVLVNEMNASIQKVKNLLARTTEKDRFEYIEAKTYYNNSYYSHGGTLYNWDYLYGKDDDYGCNVWYISAYASTIGFIEDEVYADTELEALGSFLMNHPDLCVNDICEFVKE